MTVQNKISLAFSLVVETNESSGEKGPRTYLHILCGLLLVDVNLMCVKIRMCSKSLDVMNSTGKRFYC